MSDNEGALDLRLLGVDLDDNEARELANEVFRLYRDGSSVAHAKVRGVPLEEGAGG
jgi:hypothetical protein